MENETGENIRQGIQKLNELIRDIKVAMLTTVCSDGSLHSRPMVNQPGDFDGTLWFFTRDDSPKAQEIQGAHQVNIAYASSKTQRYVSVSGQAEAVKDRGKFNELWNSVYESWFPAGLNDPHLCLLKVKVESAQYWDSPGAEGVELVGWENKRLSLVS